MNLIENSSSITDFSFGLKSFIKYHQKRSHAQSFDSQQFQDYKPRLPRHFHTRPKNKKCFDIIFVSFLPLEFVSLPQSYISSSFISNDYLDYQHLMNGHHDLISCLPNQQQKCVVRFFWKMILSHNHTFILDSFKMINRYLANIKQI